MKLCITSQGDILESRVDEHFGRASYFLFVDTETMVFQAVPNVAHTPQRGAGAVAAQIVIDGRADALLTGSIGPEAFGALRTGYVQVFEGASQKDTVRDALGKFKEGLYRESDQPSGGPWAQH
ncbi:MAG: NifB/NifX family molybdenum-iron cluster-binding protein [Thermodesulfovibrionales bacterium]